MKIEISFHGSGEVFAPGATLGGECVWSGAARGQDESGEVHLLWYTDGRGTQDVELLESIPFRVSGASGSFSFHWILPESPYSFSGKLISLIWCVEAVIAGTTERENFVLSPFTNEITL